MTDQNEAVANAIREAHWRGWINAAAWADRDDLLSDRGSHAYRMLEDEAVSSCATHPARGVVDEDAILALVAGPHKYHHKMDERAEREANAFNRCRDLTIQNIKTFFALQAAQPAVPAVSDGEAVIDRNEGGEIVAVIRRGNEWVSLKVVADHTKLDQDAQPAVPSVPEGFVLVRKEAIERAAKMAEVFDDGSDGADAETASRIAHDLHALIATPKDQPAQGVG